MKKSIIAMVTIATFLVACKGTKQTTTTTPTKPTVQLDCSTKMVSYATDIKSIIEDNCAGCHNTNNKAGFNFLTIASSKKAALNGELLGTIKHKKGFPAMPKYKEKLPQQSIDLIECWINNGMKD